MPPKSIHIVAHGRVDVTLPFAAVLVALLASAAYQYRDLFLVPSELRPLGARKLTELPELSDADYRNQMLWGSYRPGMYFGMRTRTPEALMAGLMWFDPDSVETLYGRKICHAVNTDDGLKHYGWQRHDGSSFARKTFLDEDYNLTLSMAKSSGPESGVGGDWGVRITATKAKISDEESLALSLRAQKANWRRPKGGRQRISLVMYLGDEGVPSEEWQVMPEGEPADLVSEAVTLATGGNSHIGPWSFHVREDNSSHIAGVAVPKRKANAVASRLDYLAQPYENKHNYLIHVKEFMLSIMYDNADKNPSSGDFRLYLPNGVTTGSNMAIFQVTLSLPGTVDFVFLSHEKGADTVSNRADRVAALSGGALTALLAEREGAFEERFQRTFPPAPTTAKEESATEPTTTADADADAAAASEVAKVALSGLLGSMDYSYGRSIVRVTNPHAGSAPLRARKWWSQLRGKIKRKSVDNEDDEDDIPGYGAEHTSVAVRPYFAAPLFSVVPLRGGLPHGSLWDEGFHQLLLQRWDGRMSRDVMAHWLDLMNTKGWIPRHQILSSELLSRVGHPASIQSPAESHPPTLMLPLLEVAKKLLTKQQQQQQQQGGQQGGLQDEDADDDLAALAFLELAWPRLEIWYRWYNSSLMGQLPGSFRWRGRNADSEELNPMTNSSGMDDFPRASHPSDVERHLDLRCWMALASEAMVTVGDALGLAPEKTAMYRTAWQLLGNVGTLDVLYMHEESGQYRDWGLHTAGVKLKMLNRHKKDEKVRVVSVTPTPQLVPHFGYVSLFPLIIRTLPADSPQLGKQLELLADSSLLWSPHGLRSLAVSSSLYKAANSQEDTDPRWRGNIALNINYLVLKALDQYRQLPGPYQGTAADLYTQLRQRLVKTVVNAHRTNGHLCEAFDDGSGDCVRNQPFVGWTALITLIVAQPQ